MDHTQEAQSGAKTIGWIIGGSALLAGAFGFLNPNMLTREVALGFLGLGGLALPPVSSVLGLAIPFLRRGLIVPISAAVLILALFGYNVVAQINRANAADGAGQAQTASPITATPQGSAIAPKVVDPELDAWAKLSPEEKFLLRVDEELLPELEKLPTDAPTNVLDLWYRLGGLENIVRQIREAGSLKFSGAQAKKIETLRRRAVEKQVQLYPVWRAAFAKISAQNLWENNIEVTARGRSIEFSGGLFASNANIKEVHETLAADLRRLRFDKATYSWIKDGEGWSYRLGSPSDREIVEDSQ